MRPVSYERLLKLAHQRAIDGKGGLAASIAKMCLDSRADLSAEELRLTFEILRRLIDQVELQIRRYIADYLAEREDVPHDLIQFLANDTINVAYPILVHSGLLEDDDLIAIVQKQGHSHSMAIAERNGLSEAVSRSLIDSGDDEVIVQLLKNYSARIDRPAMETLVEMSREKEIYRESLVRRRDLPGDLAVRMYVWVGDALRQYISQNFDIEKTDLDQAVTDAITSTMQNGLAPAGQGGSPDAIKNADDLYQVFKKKGFDAFVKAFTGFSGLNTQVASDIFSSDNLETMAIACKAVDFRESQFLDLVNACVGTRGKLEFDNSEDLVRTLDYFKRINSEGAKSILAHWKQSQSNQIH